MILTALVIADCGDYVVLTNARDIHVSGRKADQLVYRKHSMFPGGLKEIPYKVMQERKPDEVRYCFLYYLRLACTHSHVNTLHALHPHKPLYRALCA